MDTIERYFRQKHHSSGGEDINPGLMWWHDPACARDKAIVCEEYLAKRAKLEAGSASSRGRSTGGGRDRRAESSRGPRRYDESAEQPPREVMGDGEYREAIKLIRSSYKMAAEDLTEQKLRWLMQDTYRRHKSYEGGTWSGS